MIAMVMAWRPLRAIGNAHIKLNVYRITFNGEVREGLWRDCHQDEHDKEDWYSGYGNADSDAGRNKDESASKKNSPQHGWLSGVVGHC